MVLSWEIVLFIYIGLYISEAVLWRITPQCSVMLGINLPIKSTLYAQQNATTEKLNNIVSEVPKHLLTVSAIKENKWQLRDGASANLTIHSGYRRYSPLLRALLTSNEQTIKLTLLVPWSLVIAPVLCLYHLGFPTPDAWPAYLWIITLLIVGISYTQLKAYISAFNKLSAL